MLNALVSSRGGTFAHDPVLRGYHAIYRENEVNRCPGCGRSHWLIGRFSAECGFCSTALPLAETGFLGTGSHSRGRHRHLAQVGTA